MSRPVPPLLAQIPGTCVSCSAPTGPPITKARSWELELSLRTYLSRVKVGQQATEGLQGGGGRGPPPTQKIESANVSASPPPGCEIQAMRGGGGGAADQASVFGVRHTDMGTCFDLLLHRVGLELGV